VGDLVGQEGDVLHMAVLMDTVAELEQRLGAGVGSLTPQGGGSS
jgi:hypothetical protein